MVTQVIIVRKKIQIKQEKQFYIRAKKRNIYNITSNQIHAPIPFHRL